jgi:hypothetical protein
MIKSYQNISTFEILQLCNIDIYKCQWEQKRYYIRFQAKSNTLYYFPKFYRVVKYNAEV